MLPAADLFAAGRPAAVVGLGEFFRSMLLAHSGLLATIPPPVYHNRAGASNERGAVGARHFCRGEAFSHPTSAALPGKLSITGEDRASAGENASPLQIPLQKWRTPGAV